MTQPTWSNEKLIELWLTAKEEPIDEAARAELNQLIADNPHLRERLIQLSQEQSWLMWQAMGAGLSESHVQPASAALQTWNGPRPETNRAQWFDSAALRGTLAVAALAVLTVFALSQWSLQKGVVATAGRDGAPWQPSVLQIESGSATLELPKVGRVALEGPTRLELLEPMRARLKHGRIRVRVTEATGYGFVVEYPNGKVTDLGTEFGLNVPPPGAADDRTSLVVFEGAVNLERSTAEKPLRTSLPAQRLTRGEGVTITSGGALDRVMSIVTRKGGTFDPQSLSRTEASDAVILDVNDNLRSSDTKKFYEIVPGGFGEDVLTYVDRPFHQWNGVTEAGLPRELIGADYVKTFSDDKTRTDVEINVTLSRPAKLYVFFDDSLDPPDWLRKGFRKTKDKVGMDVGPWPTIDRVVETGIGPGKSIDHDFTVWVRIVKKPGVVTLGANRVRKNPYMYGIAAVALEAPHSAPVAENNKSAVSNSEKVVGSHGSL